MINEHSVKSFTEAEMREKIKQGLASLALEGMYPSKEMLADLDLRASGKMSKEEFLSRCIKRATETDGAE